MNLTKIALGIALACGLVFAQASTDAAKPAAAKPAAAKPAAASALTMSGKVVSVDAIANTIIIKTKKGEDTLGVDPAAKITEGKNTLALGDIKPDMHAVITYKKVEGKKTATEIKINHPKAAAPAKKEEAPAAK
jgi:nitrous oxidase accessory protein NosD